MTTDFMGRQRVMVSLKALNLFAGCSPEDLAGIASYGVVRHLTRGQRLFGENDRCLSLHYVNAGLVKLTRFVTRGGEQIIDIAGPTRMLGLTTLFTGDGYPYDAVAVDECELTVIQAGPLMRFLESHPIRLMRLATELGRDHERLVARVDQLLGRPAVQRVALYLLESSERYPGSHAPPPLAGNLRRADVANMLGLTPETFSRTLARFRKADWIRDHGGVVEVTDRERLTEILEDPSVLRPASGDTSGIRVSN